MLPLLLFYLMVVIASYGIPALIVWLALGLPLQQVVILSGIIGSMAITLLSALDPPACLQPKKGAKPRK